MAVPTDFITTDKSIPSRLRLYANGLPGVTLSLFDGLTKDEQEDYLEFWEDIYQRAWDNFTNDVQTLLADKFHVDLKQITRETSKFITDVIGAAALAGVKVDVDLSKYSVINLLTAEVFLSVPIIANAEIGWTQGTAIASSASVAYGNGRYVVVTGAGEIHSSPNGVDWTARDNPGAGTFTHVAFGNGFFVAVGPAGTVIRSEDGITWEEITGLGSATWIIIEWIDDLGIFIAATNDASSFIKTSPDGETWTERPTPAGTSSSDVVSIVYGNGSVFMFSEGDDVIRSTDGGKSWIVVENAQVDTAVAFGAGVFVSSNSAGEFVYSTNGINWTASNYAGELARVIYTSDGYFLALNTSLTVVSVDGKHWYETTAIGAVDPLGISYNDGRFVFVTNARPNYGDVSNAVLGLDVLIYDTDENGDLLGTYTLESLVEGKNVVQINASFEADDLYIAFAPVEDYFRKSENKYFTTDSLSVDKLSCTFPCGYGEGSVTQVSGGGLNVKFNVVCSIEKMIIENINLFKLAFWYRIGVELMIERRLSDRFNRWTTLTVERSEELMTIYQGEYDKHLKNSVKSLSMREDPICFQCASIVDASTVLP